MNVNWLTTLMSGPLAVRISFSSRASSTASAASAAAAAVGEWFALPFPVKTSAVESELPKVNHVGNQLIRKMPPALGTQVKMKASPDNDACKISENWANFAQSA